MTSSSRAARRSPPASLPLLLPPRPRAPPPGGFRKRRGRRAADKPRPALRCGRRPRPRDTSGRRAPAAAAPRAGAVSQQNANARGRGGHTKRAWPPQRSFASSPGRAARRVGGGRRPAEDSASAAAAAQLQVRGAGLLGHRGGRGVEGEVAVLRGAGREEQAGRLRGSGTAERRPARPGPLPPGGPQDGVGRRSPSLDLGRSWTLALGSVSRSGRSRF